MSYAEGAEALAIDQAPVLIRAHPRSGLSGAAKKALTSPSDTLKAEDVASVRDSFRGMFGPVTADQALRQIDQRLTGGLDIKGEHVQTAALAAMEMMSPLIRCEKAVKSAEAGAKLAGENLIKAQRDLEHAQRNKEDRARQRERDKRSALAYVANQKADQELEEATRAEKTALLKAKKADADLDAAKRNLETCRKSLEVSFKPGDDEVVLQKRYSAASQSAFNAAEFVNAAAKAVKLAQDRLNAEGQPPNPASLESLENAQQLAAEADLALQRAQNEHRAIAEQISALTAGPGLRRAQVLLDNMGSDPRLQKEMAETAPSSYAEKGVAFVKSNVQPKELGKTAIGLIPLVSTFTKYAETVDHEDTERRLNAATGRLGATPMAASMSQALARDAEISKAKSGIGMAIGFFASGISTTIPTGIGEFGGSALGALLGPALAPISTGVQEGTSQALGALGGEILGQVASGGTSWTVKKTATLAITKGAEEIAPDQLDADRRQRAETSATAADFDLPEGSAMPVIPKPGGSGEVWALSDPKVAKALLAYLGPGPDKAMLADPQRHDAEERRLLLREQTFGTPREVDLSPGRAASELEQQLTTSLHKGIPGPRASPLEILYAALGWVKT